jgi:hypothetical protein
LAWSRAVACFPTNQNIDSQNIVFGAIVWIFKHIFGRDAVALALSATAGLCIYAFFV